MPNIDKIKLTTNDLLKSEIDGKGKFASSITSCPYNKQRPLRRFLMTSLDGVKGNKNLPRGSSKPLPSRNIAWKSILFKLPNRNMKCDLNMAVLEAKIRYRKLSLMLSNPCLTSRCSSVLSNFLMMLNGQASETTNKRSTSLTSLTKYPLVKPPKRYMERR